PAPAPATSVPEAPPADPKRGDRPTAETLRTKAAPAAAPTQTSNTRKAGGQSAAVAESCAEGQAALGLCGRTQQREPQRAQCTDAVAALGLCESKTIQGRE